MLLFSQLHNHPVSRATVFAIGVGQADREELKVIACKPTNNHVYMLNAFADMEHLKTQLTRNAARGELFLLHVSSHLSHFFFFFLAHKNNKNLYSLAPTPMRPNTSASGSIESGSYLYSKLKAKRHHGGATIKVSVFTFAQSEIQVLTKLCCTFLSITRLCKSNKVF